MDQPAKSGCADIFPKALVAEDNANEALQLQQAFKKARIHATVHFVSDGMEVVEYLRGKQLFEQVASSTLPGLLVLNLGMPRLSGFGVLEWLRRHPHLRPSVIVALGNRPEERTRALALGADEYIVKQSGSNSAAGLVQALLQRFRPSTSRCLPPKVSEEARLALSP
jgi:CheY-like chemotaxis protein